MTTLAMRRSALQTLTPLQRRILTYVTERLDLGDPADYTAPPNTRWMVWDDDRITLRDMAAMGTITADMAGATQAVQAASDAGDPIKPALVAWVQAHWDTTPPPDSTPNPWQWVLTNNNAPAAVQAASSPPANWTPTP